MKWYQDLIVQASEDFNQTSTAISSSAFLGNIFIFMFAGHEANANTLSFIIILLACHPGIQTAFQADVDRILGAAPPSEWSLDAHYPALATSHVGAVIKEALRLFSVLQFIAKRSPATPHLLPLGSKNYVIPADTLVLVNNSAIHRHPDVWPSHSRSSGTSLSASNSVDDFNPGRWFHAPADSKGGQPPDQFLKPIPGGYLPFSDGNRGCLGRRFALVELVALVTRIFRDFSVELITDCDANAPDKTRSPRWRDAREAAVASLAFQEE